MESDSFSNELSVTTLGTASGSGSTSGTGAAATSAGLSIANVSAQDNKTIVIEFSEALSADAVVLKVKKTSDSSDVPVTEAKVDPALKSKVFVTIGTQLDPETPYSITVESAKDEKGTEIAEANKTKEFTTVKDLVQSPLAAAPATATGTTANPADVTKTKSGPQENLIIMIALLISF